MKEFLDTAIPLIRDNFWLQAAAVLALSLVVAKVVDFVITRFVSPRIRATTVARSRPPRRSWQSRRRWRG